MISTRSFASVGLSVGVSSDDCSARNAAETTKGMSWGSTLSLTRSSGVMGGGSGEGALLVS